ncbi:MAG: hypothetical protein QHJ34_08065 [bacterium]|jgi:hypothetical protein|nr:hypothetical protein [candidate division KSB1 bacterium]MDH7560171.1 hypothetical protein [bacterium]
MGTALVATALVGTCFCQQYDFSYFAPVAVGNGARALAMGGAGVAVVNDGMATAVNPAALARISGSRALVAGRFTFGGLSVDPSTPLPADVSLEGSLGSNLVPEYVGIVVPLSTMRRRITGSLAVRSMLDFGRSTLFRRIIGHEFPIKNYRDIEQTSTGGLYALSAALGAELNSRLAAGVTVNFLSGRQRVEWSDRAAEEGVEQEQGSWRRENKLSGFSLDVGCKANVSRFLDLGLKLSLSHTLTLVRPTLVAGGVDTTSADLNLKVPMFLTIGAAVRPAQRLCLAFDFHWAGWSKASLDSAITAPGLPLPDANSLHVGVEYLFPIREVVLPVRLGFHTDPRLEREFATEPSSHRGDAIAGLAFSAGAGIQSSRVSFDLSVDFGLSTYTGRNVFEEQAEGWSVKERTVKVVLAAQVKVQ